MDTSIRNDDWTYFKIYLGNAVDRIDAMVVRLGSIVSSIEKDAKWFFLRYFDESGVHLRLRARLGGDPDRFAQLKGACAKALNELHSVPPGTYHPMVIAPGFENFNEKLAAAYNDLKVLEDRYEPEFDKYGGPLGVEIAHDLFLISSDIACEVLRSESQGTYSRKDLVPAFMDACFSAFIGGASREEFWRQYAFYWLGGNSPAAEDWRTRFFAKGQALESQGVELMPAEGITSDARAHVDRWRKALETAAGRYHELGTQAETTDEVLAFNFAHLMNNRLGLASLEEAYMATLLEVRAQKEYSPS